MSIELEGQHRCPCEGSTSRVENPETIVRITRSPETVSLGARQLTQAAFKSDKMMRSKAKKPHSEQCGASWGESLQRASIASEARLNDMAKAFATGVAGQAAGPHARINAKTARDIRDERKPDQQLLVILDDGCVDDPGHAVMRMVDGLDKSFFQEARKQLIEKFRLDG